MTKLVMMLAICWVPQHGKLAEAWRIEERVTLEHCLIMNKIFSGGGQAGAITVRCDDNHG